MLNSRLTCLCALYCIQTLILRDYWLCIVLSVLFEISEYTLQHQLPNFNECWWDHVSTGYIVLLHVTWKEKYL